MYTHAGLRRVVLTHSYEVASAAGLAGGIVGWLVGSPSPHFLAGVRGGGGCGGKRHGRVRVYEYGGLVLQGESSLER